MKARTLKTGESRYILDFEKDLDATEQTIFVFRYPNAFEKAHIIERVSVLVEKNNGSFGHKSAYLCIQMLLTNILNFKTEDGEDVKVTKYYDEKEGFHLVDNSILDLIGFENWIELGLFASSLLGLSEVEKKN